MSIFSDEWRSCLKAHYKCVVKSQDIVTKQSLDTVMNKVGFSEQELAHLHVEATMRSDEMPDDFVPEMDVLGPVIRESDVSQEFVPHPLECQCPVCIEANVIPHDADGQPLKYENEEELVQIIEEVQKKDDDPKQLSMF